MAQTSYGSCTWIPIRSREICPICGSKKGRCAKYVKENGDVILYRCKYKESNRPSNGWYIHLVNENNISSIPTKIKLEEFKQTEITDSDLILRDKVYRKLREVISTLTSSLYKEHKDNLLNRGFTEKEITNMGFFSVPKNNKVYYDNYQCKLSTAIIKELEKTFRPEELLKVPGFYKGSYQGKDFVSFLTSIKNKQTNKFEDIDGYFIPYHNANGLLVGMQYRLMNELFDENGKKVRYLWYSSKVSCGSPIDYYIPMEVELDNVLLVTEGAIKAKYAASKLKVRSLGEAGVSNYRNLIKNIQSIEELEQKKYKILLALDMDKYKNPDVIKAEIKTVTLLKSLGYSVTILEWNETEGKGIDDKLSHFGIKDLRYLNV